MDSKELWHCVECDYYNDDFLWICAFCTSERISLEDIMADGRPEHNYGDYGLEYVGYEPSNSGSEEDDSKDGIKQTEEKQTEEKQTEEKQTEEKQTEEKQTEENQTGEKQNEDKNKAQKEQSVQRGECSMEKKASCIETGERSSVKGKHISKSKKRLMESKRNAIGKKIKKVTTQLGHMSTDESDTEGASAKKE